ncbi:MAG: HEPN domain-containing protein [Candidatus Sumerlaeota bacterium]|nr:HEPN domain-containing protein [Candidatus Sumerlaeota bacterium]
MSQAWAYLRQVDCDLCAAKRLLQREEVWTYCQVIAKYQQAVEKALKAIVLSLVERGIVDPCPRFTHGVSALFSVLEHLSKKKTRTFYDDLAFLLDESFRIGVMDLCGLAPTNPPPGQPVPPNTEYPFKDDKGSWVAPADKGSFLWNDDIKRFQDIRDRICPKLPDILASIERSPE